MASATTDPGATVRAILDRYPHTYAEELGLRDVGTPSGAFRLLVMAMLMASRIRADQAAQAARALFAKRWWTPRTMGRATWQERVTVLNEHGYARFDESTSTMLGDTSALLLDRYRGDLRRLRTAADGDPRAIRRLLQECKGVGPLGADIFCREAQRAWDELHPFADRRSLDVARDLGLPDDPSGLADLVGRRDLPRLVEGLTRVRLDGAEEDLQADP